MKIAFSFFLLMYSQCGVLASWATRHTIMCLDLNHQSTSQQVNATESSSNTKEQVWHGLDYNVSADIDFCELCVEGKHHRDKFPENNSRSS